MIFLKVENKPKFPHSLSYTMDLNIFTFFLMFHGQYIDLQQFFFWLESELLNFFNPSYLPSKQSIKT